MRSDRFARFARALTAVVTLALATFALNIPVHAADAAGCGGGDFAITGLAGGAPVAANPVGGDLTTTIDAGNLVPGSWSPAGMSSSRPSPPPSGSRTGR